MDLPSPSPELGAWLAENREPLIRRWMELVVERSSLDELAARPMAERVRELDLLLEAARGEAGPAGRLGGELDGALREALAQGHAFGLALLCPPADGPPAEAWAQAVAETSRREERVVTADGGITAVLIPATDAAAARVEADRVRTGAWQLLGGSSVLPDLGFAMHPDDGADAAALVAKAQAGLPAVAQPDEDAETEPEPEGERPRYEPPAFSEDLRVSRGGERRDLWHELSERPPDSDDDGPAADVTPLYPPQPE